VIDSALRSSPSLELSYQQATDGAADDNGEENEDEEEEREMRRSMAISAGVTTLWWPPDTSVVKLYKAVVARDHSKGLMPDAIIDANYMIHYVKYTATHAFSVNGAEKRRLMTA